jgi:CRP/FNR family transcriptional regulator, cyclic AMP receptor protein
MGPTLPQPGILRSCVPLFATLSDAKLQSGLKASQYRIYPARRYVLSSQQMAEGLYVLLSGAANMVLESADGRRMIIDVLRPPDFFGEAALFDIREDAYSVVCRERCAVLCVPGDIVREWTNHDPCASSLLARHLALRLAQTRQKLADLAFLDVHGRVARILLQLGRNSDGQWLIDLGTEEIAARVAASREMVARVLSRLISKGVVRRESRRINVLDRNVLLAGAQDDVRQSAGLRSG